MAAVRGSEFGLDQFALQVHAYGEDGACAWLFKRSPLDRLAPPNRFGIGLQHVEVNSSWSRRNLWLMVEPKLDLKVYGMPRKLRIRDAFGREQSKSG
jgi:hypothetical protein